MSDQWETETVGTVEEGAYGVGAEMMSDMMGGNGGRMAYEWDRDCVPKGQSGEECDNDEVDSGLGASEVTLERMRRVLEVRAARNLELREYGRSWQELMRARGYAMLQRGRFPMGVGQEDDVVSERVFRASRSFTVEEFDTAGGLYAAIMAGPVVANVVAKTGLGKSVKFAAQIALKTGSRVLQIAPDADLKVDNGAMLSKTVKVSRIWTAKKQPVVTMMSVAEFCGRFMVEGYEQMFEWFDVILLDEAHIPLRYFYAARAAMCSRGSDTTSLLLVTATNIAMSNMQSSLMKPTYLPKRMEDVITAPGWITSDLAVDRVMYIVESDERLDRVARLVEDIGCRVWTLSSGASLSAIRELRQAFAADSSSVRVLVAHERFGTGYSFPVVKVVTTGLRMVLEITQHSAKYKPTPLMKSEVTQHVCRANRGGLQAAGAGVVLLRESDILADVGLIESERFGTALLLIAMGIKPCPMLAENLAAVFPMGITRRVAVSLLNVVGLPPEITVRFLGGGGRLPAAFAAALDKFSLEHIGGLASREDVPKDYGSWFEEKPFAVLGYEDGPVVKVPLQTEGELQAVLHAVACIQAKIYVPESVPARREEPDHSGPEDAEPRRRRFGARGFRPPAVLDIMPEEEVLEPKETVFRVEVPRDRQPAYGRREASVFGATFIADLNKALEQVVVEEVEDDKGRKMVTLVGAQGDGTPVEVRGEGIVFTLPKPMWAQLSNGEELNMGYVKTLLVVLRKYCRDFAFSNCFANYGNPWLSVLLTFSNASNLRYVAAKNLGDELMAFFGFLWERYVGGMRAAVGVSHEAQNWWHRLVHSWGGNIVRPIGDPRVNIAQSRAFKTRLYDIRAGFSNLLIIMEQGGMFTARGVSEIQRVLPVSVPVGDRVHDAVWRRRARPRVKLDDRDGGGVNNYGGWREEIAEDVRHMELRMRDRMGSVRRV